MTLASPSKLPLKQACDNCRRRKIKCSRELPCDKCQRLFLSCSYSDVLRRKGPKFRTLYPLAPGHPLATGNYSVIQPFCAMQDGCSDAPYFGLNVPSSPTPPPSDTSAQFPLYSICDDVPQSSHTESVSSPDSIDFSGASILSPTLPQAGRLSPEILLAHFNAHQRYLLPIMPVVYGERLHMDCQQPEWLSPQRYSFLASLCAATHIQLKLDDTVPSQDLDGFQRWTGSHQRISGEMLLEEVLRARREYDIVEDRSIENLLTSFFLYASYGNMDKQDHAWFYLCQATSMAFTLGLHRESTYEDFTVEEAEERRRVFWLLFITERGYALQQSKPLMLPRSIQKPQALCSENPILAYGFVNLINIFDKLTASIYDGVLEAQDFDILIVQQWLQTMMWKIPVSSPQPRLQDNALLSFHLPVMSEKASMRVISIVSPGSTDPHSIEMEQRTFNAAASINVKSSFDQNFTQPIVDPRELLWSILQTVSQIRGSPSYRFPVLLERCKALLELNCSVAIGNPLPSFATTLPNQSTAWAREAGEAGDGCDSVGVPIYQPNLDVAGEGEVIESHLSRRIGCEFHDCIPP
ncbi:hypothetical protein N7495_006650 [Penicillium taxi]|uniref:uncharacterized protein n=1 Tax=Penicillium taxi TaxID=168475 RepID=UPI0025454741|nr:uncharacterized protein N7495_006650 [Penicillium taxi]KAJ5894959.1 hypothetical protein N7495_006650 [Penicillium taxi]